MSKQRSLRARWWTLACVPNQIAVSIHSAWSLLETLEAFWGELSSCPTYKYIRLPLLDAAQNSLTNSTKKWEESIWIWCGVKDMQVIFCVLFFKILDRGYGAPRECVWECRCSGGRCLWAEPCCEQWSSMFLSCAALGGRCGPFGSFGEEYSKLLPAACEMP